MDALRTQIDTVSSLVNSGAFSQATVAAQKLVILLECEQLKTRNVLARSALDPSGGPTAEEIRSLLEYDPASGHFYWRKKMSARRVLGATAGTTSKAGYTSIVVRYKAYKAHRLAWLYVHGAWPNGVIDHINGIKGDNRIANLRETSQLSNAQNRNKPNANSKSGALGVRPEGLCWKAQLTTGGQTVQLGAFLSKEEASEAYQRARHRTRIGSLVNPQENPVM